MEETVYGSGPFRMLDLRKLRELVEIVGWRKATFLLCIALLASRTVTFEQCLILLLLALAPELSRKSEKERLKKKAKPLARSFKL